MAESTVTTPYATAIPFIAGEIPAWLDEYNAQRLASYDLYDDLYDNSPSTYSLMLRGSDEKPIFVPSAKRLVNTMARYVGKGWGFAVDPALGEASQQDEAKLAFSNLFAREKIMSKFVSGKKEWLRRGDWVWQIIADLTKPAGKRISVNTVDPRLYFPLEDPLNPDRLTGGSLVEEVLLPDGKTLAIQVQRWLKPNHEEHPSFGQLPPEEGFDIWYDVTVYELANWQDTAKRKKLSHDNTMPLTELIGIKSVPLYHMRNNAISGNPFGESELKSLESLIAGINQAISDEDLSLAISGLGQFVTDSGRPIGADGKPTGNWDLGPSTVVEVALGRKFERLGGITSVAPVQEHVAYLEEQVYGTSGVNDVALGSRGSVTESGIALAIRMQPLFDAADDKDLEINTVLTTMFYDLATMYFPVYEGLDFGEVVVYSDTDTGDRLPFDRIQRWTELVAGFEANIFSLAYVHKVLVEDFGYELGANDLKAALEQAATKAAQADPYAARVATETGDTSEPSETDDGEAAE